MSETHVRFYYRGQTLMVPLEFIARQHPGGCEVLLAHADMDITKVFEKYNHSFDAIEIMRDWRVKEKKSVAPRAQAANPPAVTHCDVGDEEEDDEELRAIVQEIKKKEAEMKTKRSWWNKVALSIGVAASAAAIGMK
ncbi:hypothetical protein AGDE_08273 [Angomonas deanei]|uniref:Cytochrome b5 heme-binding domain-containing protein n=1 Tax=Angomonas deanei TaxID=59799 RepID=A0A7G2C558_9TRYP|nr:hypothetical protein AGDE_08273 [Angomonas deanei]CAD2213897.1 hypothetical protein, conserved [Angomonas deanei]|eukprot:EPY33459.1 hypothetical protein AGDE_08273 [Angomonas deanei]